MEESKKKRAVTEANCWLFASPHERTEEGGLIMAEYVLDACGKIDCYERALSLIHKNATSSHVKNIVKKALEGNF